VKAEQRTEAYDLEEIILKFYPQISFRVKKSVGHFNPEWEDICSEIVMGVVEAIKKGKFRGDSALGTFIYSVTSKKIVDYIRKKTRVLKHIPEQNHSDDPHEHLEKKQRDETVLEALKKLKPQHADIMYLYYYMDISREQIAQIYGISPRWVSEIIKNSRKTLKKIIDR
jgi:RNA polymerase sigma-70 factor (ECF subfamily)